jgi:ATP-binding cassette subfamily B protein
MTVTEPNPDVVSSVHDPNSPFVPVAVEEKSKPAPATIHPDKNRTWLKRATPILMAHKGIFFGSLGLSLVGLLLQVEIPNLVRQAIDNSIVAHHKALSFYVGWILVFAFGRWISNFFARKFLFNTAYAIEYDFRTLIYEHLERLSFSFYDRVQSGQLISRANSDIRAVQMYLTFAPSILVQCSIALVAFGFMLSINVVLALVTMALMPLVFVIGVKMRQAIFPVSWLIQARLADVATIVDENVNGVRVVKSFAAEESQLKTLDQASTSVEWAYTRDADIRAKWSPTMENLPRLGLALVLLVGGWMAVNGHATVGEIVAFNAYVLLIQPPFRMLGMIIMLSQRANASAERIYEILDEVPEIVDRPGAVDLVDCKGDVRFDHVNFDYPNGTPVLRDFDLHLKPGETVALVGRTGAGKSTVSRLLTRFYDVTDGAVQIDGTDVRNLTLASLRHHVGIVLDEPFLFSVSIRDNIAYGRPTASFEEVRAAAIAANADEFIRDLPEGYDTVVGERGYTLSGGQRQRIAIARTLVTNPPVLVLDDATSAIDVHVEEQIHGALRNLMGSRTTIIIAHRLSTISLADRVLLLEDGHIVADGTHADLLANEPRYTEVLAQGLQEDEVLDEPDELEELEEQLRRERRERDRLVQEAHEQERFEQEMQQQIDTHQGGDL